MSNQELQILQHSLGLNEYGQGEQYRNHFVTGKGSKDFDACNNLVSIGYMDVRRNHALSGGDDCFFVTESGKKFVADNSPKPPKLSKSKQRYQRYLDYGDCFDSFREFLKWDCDKDRSWN
jgi:hypothetical protein